MRYLFFLAVVPFLQDPTPDDLKNKVLPPLKKITLEVTDAPLEEVLKQLEEKTGLGMVPPYSGKNQKITLSVKDASPLQALDELCRKSKNLGYSIQDVQDWDKKTGKSVSKGVKVVFQNQAFGDAPAVHIRHYKVWSDHLQLNRATDFAKDRIEGTINLRVGWTPDVKPEAIRFFRIDEILDDQARSLLRKETNQWGGLMRIQYQPGWYQAFIASSFSFKYPEPDVKKLSLVKGRAVLRFPSKIETVVFDNPFEGSGPTKEVKGLTLKLKDCKLGGTSVQASVEVGGKYTPPDDPYNKEVPIDRWETQYPFTPYDIVLTLEDGSTVKPSSVNTSMGKTTTFSMNYTLPEKSVVKAVRIDSVVEYFFDEIPFELKDVKLP